MFKKVSILIFSLLISVSFLSAGAPRPCPIAKECPDKGGELPPCVPDMMCANGRTCVPSDNGSGCCAGAGNRGCDTANPGILDLNGGSVLGWRLVRNIETNEFRAVVGGVAVDLFTDSVTGRFRREKRVSAVKAIRPFVKVEFPDIRYYQFGLYVTEILSGSPLINGEPVLVDGFVNDRGFGIYEYIPSERLVPREIE